MTYSYACKNCEDNTGDTKIISTKPPKSIIHKSMASNELLSHVIVMKYLHSLLLYRQESYFKMLGANLSRQTLSNWIIGVSNAFKPIYSFMKDKLLKSHYVQADETTLKVINDNSSEAKSKKYMWLYKNCSSKTPIILYDYQKTRSISCPKNFLKYFSGYLQTDGYSGYNSVCNAKRLYCLAHIRRKYHEIIINLNEEALKKSRAIIGFNFCEQLYKIEKNLREEYSAKENFYEKRKEIRNKEANVVLEEFEKYVKVELENALPKSPLGKALEYTQKLLPKMKLILEDGSLEIDTNAAERAIKPFVIGRKNWLFSNTPKGAKSSATLYSIIETAKANNLIVEKYLIHLMNSLSEVDIITD
ncbi:IS66 family transposase [Clostridium perfringens]|nr:IS66 family transposase [Clostridium perfringens]MDK0770367.1 IS66 family transposase [Clostridium perfringens]MDK0775513.1 IS66 family transposase [Clostridium perfringens]